MDIIMASLSMGSLANDGNMACLESTNSRSGSKKFCLLNLFPFSVLFYIAKNNDVMFEYPFGVNILDES